MMKGENMKKYGLMIGLAMLLSACGGASDGNSSAAKNEMAGIFADPQWRGQFIESCVQGAKNSGGGAVPEGVIKSICDCAADELPKKVSAADMASQNREKIMPVMQECSTKVLAAAQ